MRKNNEGKVFWTRLPKTLLDAIDKSARLEDRTRVAELRVRLARDLEAYPPGAATPAKTPGRTED